MFHVAPLSNSEKEVRGISRELGGVAGVLGGAEGRGGGGCDGDVGGRACPPQRDGTEECATLRRRGRAAPPRLPWTGRPAWEAERSVTVTPEAPLWEPAAPPTGRGVDPRGRPARSLAVRGPGMHALGAVPVPARTHAGRRVAGASPGRRHRHRPTGGRRARCRSRRTPVLPPAAVHGPSGLTRPWPARPPTPPVAPPPPASSPPPVQPTDADDPSRTSSIKDCARTASPPLDPWQDRKVLPAPSPPASRPAAPTPVPPRRPRRLDRRRQQLRARPPRFGFRVRNPRGCRVIGRMGPAWCDTLA